MRASKPPRAIAEAAEAFLRQKRVNGCSPRTVEVYKFWRDRLAAVIPDTAALDSFATTKFFASLRERRLRVHLSPGLPDRQDVRTMADRGTGAAAQPIGRAYRPRPEDSARRAD